MLITLAIIGVVAALTIPTLVANYQKKQHVAKLQKAYTTIANGFQLMKAEEGVDSLRLTQFGKKTATVADMSEVMDAINTHLPKYFKIANSCYGSSVNDCPMYAIKYKDLSGNIPTGIDEISNTGLPYFQLQDGTTYFYLGNIDGASAIWALDTNGEKGPNQLGRDFFMHGPAIVDVDSVDPTTGKTNFGAMKITTYLKLLFLQGGPNNDSYSAIQANGFFEGNQECGRIGSSDISGFLGICCLDRIIEEGWKMNY